jgi:hypothetical protein
MALMGWVVPYGPPAAAAGGDVVPQAATHTARPGDTGAAARDRGWPDDGERTVS